MMLIGIVSEIEAMEIVYEIMKAVFDNSELINVYVLYVFAYEQLKTIKYMKQNVSRNI